MSGRPSWRRIAALTLVGCVISVAVVWLTAFVSERSGLHDHLVNLSWDMVRQIEQRFALPNLLGNMLGHFFPMCWVLAPAAWASAFALQCMGPRAGRWGFWRCAVLVLIYSVVFCLLVDFLWERAPAQRDRFLKSLLWIGAASWGLAWNFFWAWQVAKREAGMGKSA